MLLTKAEIRQVILGGAVSLVGIAGFVGLATFALLLSSGTSSILTAVFEPYILRVLRFTLLQALLSTLLSVVFAIPVAQALARQRHFPGRIWIIRLMAVPMGLPVLIGALGLIGIWGRLGILNSLLLELGMAEPISIYGLSGILLAHVFFNMPLACRLMLAALERVPAEYWLMASGLGMRPGSIFRFIEWPVLRSVIPGIAGLIFMLCATSFTLVLTLGGGPAATTVEVAIYQSLRFDFDPGRAVALSLLQIVLTAVILGGLSLLPAPEDEGMTAGKAVRRPDGQLLTARLADGSVVMLAALFLGLPLMSVVLAGLRSDLMKLLSERIFWQSAATSLAISISAAVLALLISMTLVSARRAVLLRGSAAPGARAFFAATGGASSLVLLVPPIVLATGWFLALTNFGDVSVFAPLLIVAINALMSLPFVMRVLEPAFIVHKRRTQKLAASLGVTGWARLRLVDMPALFKPMLTAFSFAMALSLGDLGAVALFGSDSFVTLPWLVYSRMGSYRTNDADGLALILGLVCLLLTIAGTMGPARREGAFHA
ncbi:MULTISPECIES: thiamine/thiamine pyrophosphate ABC transporter permease ThiP [Rhizobium]|uniref:Thiamine transport system permease protein ThiP n=1 Tax=Rhizobium favelukesii TaxID=348824 RepID=W6RZJ7_9HYPH|nr:MULTISPECIES: thiamine/thiamine pyrophosphate ABC transporter permease ThiP [Rhizobium]MCA0803715.1 thiamine/thiamine pyrophosphate ABC transporter permease ThiP [Rhizobium sp. T1473]MCS0457211.1 thiamine/thiamine pyrophosphate ABC transporter permease ThiP [Rhizobium favelukesii]UFS82717.1 thiamine/thiamine pyrophosphate ABC transporter permease ThiP [Rhizobium sp. T136]CDM59701.1 Thiamine transport system permease protein [Rhizobium favelukesii]